MSQNKEFDHRGLQEAPGATLPLFAVSVYIEQHLDYFEMKRFRRMRTYGNELQVRDSIQEREIRLLHVERGSGTVGAVTAPLILVMVASRRTHRLYGVASRVATSAGLSNFWGGCVSTVKVLSMN